MERVQSVGPWQNLVAYSQSVAAGIPARVVVVTAVAAGVFLSMVASLESRERTEEAIYLCLGCSLLVGIFGYLLPWRTEPKRPEAEVPPPFEPLYPVDLPERQVVVQGQVAGSGRPIRFAHDGFASYWKETPPERRLNWVLSLAAQSPEAASLILNHWSQWQLPVPKSDWCKFLDQICDCGPDDARIWASRLRLLQPTAADADAAFRLCLALARSSTEDAARVALEKLNAPEGQELLLKPLMAICDAIAGQGDDMEEQLVTLFPQLVRQRQSSDAIEFRVDEICEPITDAKELAAAREKSCGILKSSVMVPADGELLKE